MNSFQEAVPAETFLNRNWLAAIVLFILPISGVAIDIYVPSLPEVSQFFGVNKALAQLSVTAYMIGIGLMQLFAGSLTDSFGRKKPFSLAMLIFLIATLLIPFAQSIYQLLFLRLVQGLVAAVVVVPMRAVIADLFKGRDFFKMVNYMTMAWSIGPIVAPAIGGYLQNVFGWQACFYFLAIYSFISLLLVWFCLPETSVEQHPFRLLMILKRYREILSHREFIKCVLLNGILYALVILFSIVGPFLIQQVLHYSPAQFGRVALLTGLAWFLGTITNRFFIHVDLVKKAKLCFWLMLIISFSSLLLTIWLPLSIYLVVVPLLILLWIGGIQFPNNFASAVGLFPRSAGSANALFGGILFLLSGSSSCVGTFLKSTSAVPLAAGYFGLVCLCLVVFYSVARVK